MAHEIITQRVQFSRISEFDENNIGFGKIYTDHMFVCDWDGTSWKDARIVPYGNMHISPATSALHYGQSIFEGMKAFRTDSGVQLFRPLENWKRFNVSATRMVMPNVPESVFMGGILQLVDIDREWVPSAEGSALYIRPFMFATDDFIGVRPSTRYRFCVFCSPVGPYYNKPLKVKVETEYSRAAPGGTGFAKCAGNYAASLLPAKIAQEEGYDQVLWTDPIHHEFVEETGTTNIFAIINGVAVTPVLDLNLLAGITRDSAIKVLKYLGITVEERKLTVTELVEAHGNGSLSELFITGTAATLITLQGFGINGTFYDVFNQDNNPVATQVKSFLDALRYGLSKDIFSWMVPVGTSQSA